MYTHPIPSWGSHTRTKAYSPAPAFSTPSPKQEKEFLRRRWIHFPTLKITTCARMHTLSEAVIASQVLAFCVCVCVCVCV